MATFYVSAAAANGIPAGSDQTGNGSRENPFATIEQANASAKDGDTIMLNDGVYIPAKTLEVSNAVSIESVTDYGATIRAAAGQSRVIGISEDQGGVVSFGKIIIDGGNSATGLVVLHSQPATYTVEMEGTKLVNATSYGIQGTSAGTNADLKLTDVDFSSASALSMLNIPSMTGGSVSIEGGSVDIGSMWRSGFGGIATVNADGAGVTANISGVTANLHATGTAASHANGKGIYYGIRLTDVAAPLIEHNTITQTGTSTDQTGYTMLVTYDRVNPHDISGGIIRYNTLSNHLDGSAGKIILVGWDGDPGAGLRNYANDFEIYGNSGIGDVGSEASNLHGILVGWQDGAKVYDNNMDYTDLAYVLKGMSGETLVFDNTDTHTSNKSLYQKGGTGVQFLYNTSYQADGYNPDAIMVGDAGIGEYLAHGAVIVGNTVVYTSTPDTFLTVAEGSSAANISDNNYYAPKNASQAWIYGSNSYGTVDTWRAAVESDASYSANVEGVSLGQGAIFGATGLSGQKLQLVGIVNGVQTYSVSFVTGTASTTTFAIGNFGAAGAAVISGIFDGSPDGTGSRSLSGSALTDGTYTGLGSGELLTFTISYDGLSAVGGQSLTIYGNYTNTRPITIVFQSIEAVAPSISGGSSVSVTDAQSTRPFGSMRINDSDTSSDTQTLRVTISDPDAGEFSVLAGFVGRGGGLYEFTGTVAEANAALQALRFTPAANQAGVGSTVTAQFTVTYTNGSHTVSSTAAQVAVTSVNDVPALSGLEANQTVGDGASATPFASTSFSDPDPGQMMTLTIALDKVARGSFTNLNGFVDNGDGTYSFHGTAAAADAALRGLVFNTNPNQAAVGESTTAKLTITYSDGVAPTQTSVSYLQVLSENDAPVVAGAAPSGTLDTKAIKPFAEVTITDPDKGAIETVTVRLDDPAKGVFTSLGGFTDNGDGSYSFSGSPGAVQAALRSMVFDPADWRTPGGTTEDVRFTIIVSDGTATTTDDSTVVTVTSTKPVNRAPVVAAPPADQGATAGASFSFTLASNTFMDPDAGDTLVLSATQLPDWLSFDAATRTFAGTPTAPGSYTVTVQAMDAAGATVADSFVIEVGATPAAAIRIEAEDFTRLGAFSVETVAGASDNEVIRLPKATSGAASTDLATFGVTAGKYDVQVAYLDESDGKIGASLWVDGVKVGDWRFDAATSGNGTEIANLRTITFEDVTIGANSVLELRATASNLELARIDYVNLTPVGQVEPNRAPVVAAPPADQGATAGASFSFTLASNTFMDPDAGDTLVLSATQLPDWLSFDAATRTFAGTPTAPGSYTVTVQAMDAAGATVADSFVIEVGATPAAAIRIEAEDFTRLGAFSVETVAGASDNEVIRLPKATSGAASTDLATFGVTAGKYDVQVAYLDESDGKIGASLWVDGVKVGDWRFDAATSGNGTEIANLRTITFEDVTIGANSVLELRATASNLELARIDYVDIWAG
jgi:hypothetical protein